MKMRITPPWGNPFETVESVNTFVGDFLRMCATPGGYQV
jgi:hypothetical protein